MDGIRLESVLVENGANVSRLDDRDADIEGAHLVIERFRIPLDRVLGRCIMR